MVGGRLNTSAERGVLATDEGVIPLIMPAVRELGRDLKPAPVLDVRVPLFEKVEDVPVRPPPFKVVPVRWIGVGRAPELEGSTGFGG